MIRRGLAGPALAAADTACRPRTNAHTHCYNNRGLPAPHEHNADGSAGEVS
jgi:hypothetical protein